MTDAEQCLWQCLRGTQLDGCRFRRQHPIERFVLDCYCPAVRLVIEIDGAQHHTAPGRASDDERTRCLNTRGIRVLWFWHHEVWQDLPGVLERIWDALHLPPSLPPPAGGRYVVFFIRDKVYCPCRITTLHIHRTSYCSSAQQA